MIGKSLLLTKKIFKPYKKLIKAGVILHNIQSNKYIQKPLSNGLGIQKEIHLERLDNVIDNINTRNGINTIGWGSSVIEEEWNPSRRKLSSTMTTSLDNIATIYAI